MKLGGLEYYNYSLPLKTSFITSAGNISECRGIILKISDEKGNEGFGDIPLLKGFNSEDESEIIKELESSNPQRIEVTDEFPPVGKLFRSRALQFAFDQAITQIILKNNPKTLNVDFVNPVKVNAVTSLSNPEVLEENIRKFISYGCNTVKIKTGISDYQTELQTIRKMRKSFPLLNIRLDVNGAWSIEESLKNIDLLKDLNIQYIEQPVAETKDLIKLSQVSEIPLCADESVRCFHDAEEIISCGKIKFIVLKPSLFGGFPDFFRLKDLAEENTVNLIISSSFESSVGNSWLIMLAASLNHKFAHGLATRDFFAGDLIENPFPVSGFKINFVPEKLRHINPLREHVK